MLKNIEEIEFIELYMRYEDEPPNFYNDVKEKLRSEKEFFNYFPDAIDIDIFVSKHNLSEEDLLKVKNILSDVTDICDDHNIEYSIYVWCKDDIYYDMVFDYEFTRPTLRKHYPIREIPEYYYKTEEE